MNIGINITFSGQDPVCGQKHEKPGRIHLSNGRQGAFICPVKRMSQHPIDPHHPWELQGCNGYSAHGASLPVDRVACPPPMQCSSSGMRAQRVR